MPVHATTLPGGGSGYQWGKHGHKYASKAAAARQGRAAYANGYTGDDPHAAIGQAIRELFNGPTHGAGVALTAPDGKLLFLRRANTGDHPGHWCFPGGGCEKGETHEDAALREVAEETGYIPDGDLRPIDRQRGDIDFVTFSHPVKSAFAPKLNHEHDGVTWAHPDNPPQPLHPGVAATLAKGIFGHGQAHDDALALDKSARTVDQDGHLLVKHCLLTKAVVNPYKADEIPGWQELGLERNRVYQLYRDPAELKKAVVSLEGKPLLIEHRPITSDDHQARIVGGAVLNPEWNESEQAIYGDLSVWPQDAIDDIEDARKRDLSCGYRYIPVMESGTAPDGSKFDGRMTQIQMNHVALVTEGRVKGAMVADSALSPGWIAIDEALTELGWAALADALAA